MTNRFIITITFAFLFLHCAFCQKHQADSAVDEADMVSAAVLPTDIYAGLLIAEPGNDFYSSFGHCAVRLWCPSKKLDFCYTYCLEETFGNQLALFNGSGKGSYSAVATPQFISEYIASGRKVENYRLNLTVEQVRELWRILDGEITSGAYRQYNYLHTNCSSMSVLAVERCLGTDEIEWRNMSDAVTGTYRTFVRTISEERPWTGFVWTTLLGHEGENRGTLEHKMGPTLLPPILKASQLKSADGSLRPLLAKRQPQVLSESTIQRTCTWFTPNVLFLLLLVLSIVTVWFEHSDKAHGWVRTFYASMLAVQTIVGLVITYITVLSDMTGASLNLNLLILNPVPAIMWIALRRRKCYGNVWTVYATVICLYVLLWTVSPQVDFTHVLMALPLLVITLSKVLMKRKTTQNN